MITPADRLQSVQEYYFSRKLKEVQTLVAQGHSVINMGIGSPDLPPHPSVQQALIEALVLPKAHEYQSYQGIPELRAGMRQFYTKQFGVAPDSPIDFLPLMGSKEGILHIAMAFLNPGDQVLLPNPGYPTYAAVADLVQAEVVYYDLQPDQEWLPKFASLETMDMSKVKMIFIGYPHMPTGTPGNLELLQQWVDFARKHQLLLVNDNPYSFVLHRHPLSIFNCEGAEEVAIELNSLSKTFNMAGWRVGMAVGKPEFLEAVLKVKSNMDSGMFLGIQKGAVAALQLGTEWFEAQREIYARRRELIWQLADELGCAYDKKGVGLFVWAKLPEGSDAESLIDQWLYEHHVFITPGIIFGSNGKGYIRFSLCVSEEKIKEVLKRFNV
jgi:aspartate/methionine/tyrosine aminotransferase